MIILATGKDTGRAAHVFVKDIRKVEGMGSGSGSFTRIYLQDDRQMHEYFLDVKESPVEIGRRIKEEQIIPGEALKRMEQI